MTAYLLSYSSYVLGNFEVYQVFLLSVYNEKAIHKPIAVVRKGLVSPLVSLIHVIFVFG
jgi:hypothetical protein